MTEEERDKFHLYQSALNELREQHAREIEHLHNLHRGIPDSPDNETALKVKRALNKHADMLAARKKEKK